VPTQARPMVRLTQRGLVALSRRGKGGAGDDPGLGVPWGTIIGGKRYIRHQLMPPPGLRSEPAMVCRVGVCGSEGGWDVRC